jgi:hypothetical protein
MNALAPYNCSHCRIEDYDTASLSPYGINYPPTVSKREYQESLTTIPAHEISFPSQIAAPKGIALFLVPFAASVLAPNVFKTL